MKKKDSYLYALIFIFIGLLFFWFVRLGFSFQTSVKKDGLELIVSESRDKEGWVYSIYHKERLLIHQENLPLLQGKNRIATEQMATELGEMVLRKLRNHEPPVIQKRELIEVIASHSKKDSIF
ncbi:DUF4907 domain-containing protein [Flagellimonas meridianipacifica]|uniref:Uncharacterized protein DUF4907 n=1 Tax=Flagellimonas meridianipacifica TaxID=1080225 RepID=A0A2T0MD21_9FLAO|nr:DUF4907 domain-containing protein [Allomuricauda pacifica]PRX55401.1 uncharacterized protein DUF4907 [Allomuricauda pacifica]